MFNNLIFILYIVLAVKMILKWTCTACLSSMCIYSRYVSVFANKKHFYNFPVAGERCHKFRKIFVYKKKKK